MLYIVSLWKDGIRAFLFRRDSDDCDNICIALELPIDHPFIQEKYASMILQNEANHRRRCEEGESDDEDDIEA